MKRIVLVVLAGITAMMLTACGGPESEIKSQVNDAFKPMKEGDETAINILSEKGLSSLGNVGVDDKEFIKGLLEKASIETSVEAAEDTATATVKYTAFDNVAFNNLVKEKADEFLSSEERPTLEKEERLARGKTAVEEAVAANESTTHSVIIELKKNGDDWEPVDGSSLDEILLEGIYSDEEIKELSEALNSYSWRFDGMNASQILEKLKEEGLTIGDIQVYDEDSDPNNLLGRPNEYNSKASFLDTRIEDPYGGNGYIDGGIDTDMGGTLETFDTAKDAQTRTKYITDVTTSSGIGKMYMYTFCNAVLRVGYELKPSEAEEYEKAFMK